jgi:hypothetical protein
MSHIPSLSSEEVNLYSRNTAGEKHTELGRPVEDYRWALLKPVMHWTNTARFVPDTEGDKTPQGDNLRSPRCWGSSLDGGMGKPFLCGVNQEWRHWKGNLGGLGDSWRTRLCGVSPPTGGYGVMCYLLRRAGMFHPCFFSLSTPL